MLGDALLRAGAYDMCGKPIFCDRVLLAESVCRFKGQSAPAVIFTEIDFAEIDERVFRQLFVGMTRARLKLVLVLSARRGEIARTYWSYLNASERRNFGPPAIFR